MDSQQPLIVNFPSPCGRYTVAFEDDGKVAYAYVKRGGDIVGDVWLYNRIATPEVPEWKDRTKIPFANCKGFMREEGRISRTVSAADVNVDWELENDSPVAYVYIFDDLFGVVGVGDRPGYARFAIKDSRLGRVMEMES
jgi:hypothetical protein